MALVFRNADCQTALELCESELKEIGAVIRLKSPLDKDIPFLTRYTIIISAATLEVICKTMITDHCGTGANIQMKEFFRNKFLEKALNLKYDRLCEILKQFDSSWLVDFKNDLKNKKSGAKWKSDLNSLVDLRNDFAHGGRPTVSFQSVQQYFMHAKRILFVLERHIK